MTEVYLGLGSNQDPERNVRSTLVALDALLEDLRISPVFDCEAVGYNGPSFLNLVVAGHTSLPLPELVAELKRIEVAHGRKHDGKKFSPRPIDVDILLFGELIGQFGRVILPREEILENAFVLWPLSVLAPRRSHPIAGQTYEALWASYDQAQRLRPVPFLWRGHDLSAGVESPPLP